MELLICQINVFYTTFRIVDFFHVFIPLRSIRNTIWISLFAGNVTIHPPLSSLRHGRTPSVSLFFSCRLQFFLTNFLTRNTRVFISTEFLQYEHEKNEQPILNCENTINTVEICVFFKENEILKILNPGKKSPRKKFPWKNSRKRWSLEKKVLRKNFSGRAFLAVWCIWNILVSFEHFWCVLGCRVGSIDKNCSTWLGRFSRHSFNREHFFGDFFPLQFIDVNDNFGIWILENNPRCPSCGFYKPYKKSL